MFRKGGAGSAALPFPGSGVREQMQMLFKNLFDTTGVDMKRREFLRLLLFGTVFGLFGEKVRAEKRDDDTNGVKEAMFWRRLDNE